MKRQRDYKGDYVHSIISRFPPEEVDPFINYTKKVRARFQYHQPKKFHSFIRIVEEALMVSGVTLDGVVVGRLTDGPQDFPERFKAILECENDLIHEFNSIMPPWLHISLDDGEKQETAGEAEKERSRFRDAMDFLNKMRIDCGVNGYEEFLENLSLFKKGCKDLVDVYDFGLRVTEGHLDLQEEFLRLMPLFEAEPLSYPLPDLQSADLTNNKVDEQENRSPENIEVRERNDMETKFVRADGAEEKGGSLDDDEKQETVAATDSKTIGFREAMDFVKKLSIKCGENVYEEFLKNFRLYKKGSRNMADVCNFSLRLTEGHPDLQEDFLKFMPITDSKSLAYRLPVLQSSYLTNSKVDEQQKRSPENHKLCRKKEPETKFVKADGSEVKGSDIIKEKIREGLSFLEKVKKSLACEVNYKKFLKLLFAYSKRKIGKAELENMVSNLIGMHPDLMDEFYGFLSNCESFSVVDVRGCKEKERRREKHRNKSIEELDLSGCARCSPSYLLLPEEYRNNMTRQGSQVLNDGNMIMISRVHYKPFKHRNPNHYEINMFNCEDEQYQLDMLVEWFKSAVKYVEKVRGDRIKNDEKEGSGRIFLKCIKCLYGDQNVEVLDIFHKDPQRAQPILRMRLQQKLADLAEYRDSLKSSRAEVYAANYHKSLGPRKS